MEWHGASLRSHLDLVTADTQSTSYAEHIGREGEYGEVPEAHIAGLVLEREVHIYSSVGIVDTPRRIGLMGGTPVLSILHRSERVHYDAIVSPK